MPHYDYTCTLNHRYAEQRSILEDIQPENLICDVCGNPRKQIYSPPVIELKGTGFYRNTRK